jgi:hypothetical protein
VVSIDRPLLPLHFRRFKKIALYKAKHVFERLNNSLCKLIESSAQRCKKHNSGWFFVWIFLDSGSNLFPIENKKNQPTTFIKQICKTLYTLHFADFLYADTGKN